MSPEKKVEITPSQKLVNAAIQRLAAQRRKRNDPERNAPEFASGLLLVYKDPEVEDRFMRFIHIAPLGAILLLQCVSAITLMINWGGNSRIAQLITALFFVAMALVEIYIHLAARRLKDDADSLHRLLKWERVLISVSLMLGAAILVLRGYEILHDCAELNAWNPVGSQPKAHTEGYCQYWSGLISLLLGVLAMLQVIRFSVSIGCSIIIVLLAATLWIVPSLRPQQDDAAAVIIRVNILTFAASAFSCFIRYVDENQQRKHFEAQEKLIQAAELLSAKRVATLERFLAVLPLTVSKRLRDGQWQSSHIDVASDATVLVTRIHDFPKWSTSMLPLHVAALVAAMQKEVASLLLAGRLERVGRLGDTTVAVGNLLDRSKGNVAAMTINAAVNIVMLARRDGPELPKLLAAVHLGSVEGVLQGAHCVRYEVRGPAMEATRSGAQLCSTGGQLLGSTAIVTSATDDDDEWYQDSEPLDVETSGGPVTFRRLDQQHLLGYSQESPGGQGPSLSADADVFCGDDGIFVAGVSRLLGTHGGVDSVPMVTAAPSMKSNQSGSESNSEGESEPLEIVTDRLGFYRFADEDADLQFRQRRTRSVPQQAAKVWLGYSAFVVLVIIVLLMELKGPYAVFGTALLVMSALGSTCLAVIPKLLSGERMASVNVLWTGVGMFVPLLTVFGCALSRPSIVGLDVRPYIAFGAFMRSYCFNDARLQAVGVPAFALVSTLQYLVPGVHENLSFLPLFLIFLLATILAARNREGSELKNFRRGVIAEAVVHQIEDVTRVQQGLLRSSLPRNVFEAAVAADFRGPRSVHQDIAVVMVIRAAAPFRNTADGLGRVLDLVASTTYLSTAGVLGDDAVVVGPVPTSVAEHDDSEVETASLHEALALGIAITHSAPNTEAHALSVLLDHDTVAHVVELGKRPSYSLLGISATRLISIAASVSGMVRGLLVTDRVTAMVRTSVLLGEAIIEAQAPMTVRGQGVLRWNRIRKP